MARGNEIIVTANPRGVFMEGTIEGALKPGTAVQLKAGTEPVGGRYTYQAYDQSADGVRLAVAILLADDKQGKTAEDAYTSGDRCQLYFPLPGEELNVLIGDLAGTGATSDFAIGDKLMIDDGTGKFIDASGSEQSAPFQVLETVNDLAADGLVHAMFTGY